MTESAGTGANGSRLSTIWSAWNDPAVRLRNVDFVTVLLAAVLPWSTSGVGIAAVLWLIAFVPTVEPRALLRSLRQPASALPIAFVALIAAGLLWSDAPWRDQMQQLSQAGKLLMLPLLIYHFERSSRGVNVFVAFLVSCLLLALVSCAVAIDPDLSAKGWFSRADYVPINGIFVKNYIDQGHEFSLCAVALAYPIVTSLQAGRTKWALGLAALALWLVVNMLFVITSRTALVTMPIMLAVFALMHLRWRVALAFLCALALLAAVAWFTSHQLQETIGKFFTDYRYTKVQKNESGMGSRLFYWQKSLDFFADAPVIGHGTGATRGLFEKIAGERIGTSTMVTVVSNPHNQTLNVAVQWGVVGVVLLWAMWLVHLLLFRGEGLTSWIGLLVVVQNMLSSLINSHLFDFTEGWMYVLGVGIAAGVTLAQRASPRAAAPAGSSSA
jgi:O-antigen ligase